MKKVLSGFLLLLAAAFGQAQFTNNPTAISCNGVAITHAKINTQYWFWNTTFQRAYHLAGNDPVDINTPADSQADCPGRFSADGRYAFITERPTGSGDSGQIERFDLATGKRSVVVSEARPLHRLDGNFDIQDGGLYFVVVRYQFESGPIADYTVLRWDLTTEETTVATVFTDTAYLGSESIAVRGGWLYFLRRQQPFYDYTSQIWRRNLTTGEERLVRDYDSLAFNLTGIQLSGDGRYIAFKSFLSFWVRDLATDTEWQYDYNGYYPSNLGYCWAGNKTLVYQPLSFLQGNPCVNLTFP